MAKKGNKIQIHYFINDIGALTNKKWYRTISILLSPTFIGILIYRIERGCYLLVGAKVYSAIRLILSPVLNILLAYHRLDIHYKANIAGGLKILHGSNGIVISGQAVIGSNNTFVGGNIVGYDKDKDGRNKLIIGNNNFFGANSVILGPLTLGNNNSIGAMALLNKDFDNYNILVGVPAKMIKKKNNSIV
jgi:serine acetyltransferase